VDAPQRKEKAVAQLFDGRTHPMMRENTTQNTEM